MTRQKCDGDQQLSHLLNDTCELESTRNVYSELDSECR
jgi:hypothetical protein